ncbi:AI-2E family transporter [Streptacidiphilus monticola]|uniref:AI-2E family transporter n=1 Tax=Streptacidiphilus monticola TaxID=2161674 RepID=A0ABW1G5L1_9ACTN
MTTRIRHVVRPGTRLHRARRRLPTATVRATARGGRGGGRYPEAARSRVRTRQQREVPRSLQVLAGWAWRLLLLGVTAYAAFTLLARFQPIALAVFLALIICALLRPAADLYARWLPRRLAVVLAYLTALCVVAGLLSATGFLVAGESSRIAGEFDSGVARLERWLEGPPWHLHPGALAGLQHKATAFLSAHRSVLLQNALSSASQAVELLTTAALGVFCSVFFVHSGERMWAFLREQLPASAADRWNAAGEAAWRTFAGYTRGIVLVAATNAVLVAIALFALGVPLAFPLAVLEFVAAFVPLIGSPFALAVASVVALATRGPAVALAVLVLIVVIGQIEGHLLHPLIMSWAVRLHPVVVAIAVIAGSIALGIVGAVTAVPAVSVAWAVVQALRAKPPGHAEAPGRRR